MRTTVRMDDALLAQAKEEAARSGRTLTQVIEDALREALGRPMSREPSKERVRLRTFAGQGLRSGVDLDSAASLLDLMEADAAR
jgi:Arc/MetJ family transcription regulator